MWRIVALAVPLAVFSGAAEAHPTGLRRHSGVSVGVVIADPYYYGGPWRAPFWGSGYGGYWDDPFWGARYRGYGYGSHWGPQADLFYEPRRTTIVRESPFAQPGERVGAAPPVFYYFCEEPKGFYPEVRACPEGWVEVAGQSAESVREGKDE